MAFVYASEHKVRLAGRSRKRVTGANKVPPCAFNPLLTAKHQDSRSSRNPGPRTTRPPVFALRHAQSAPAAMRAIPTEAKIRGTKGNPGTQRE